ncbi:hypothetical protein [Haloarcula hispanica]|uniref:hypothetical protein n=1 Tax=Haloarcula hispanica TaxID=51589 RepID=UPI001CD9948F|nr:hypothetical protein [Haloarcula hispanica]
MDVSTQTLRNNETYFADLKAAGVIQRENLGPGRATEWRICLPFDGEDSGSRATTPTLTWIQTPTGRRSPTKWLLSPKFSTSWGTGRSTTAVN